MLSTSGLRSDYFWKVLLIIYFVGLIAISIAAIIRIWNPAPEVTVQTTTNNATITLGSPSIKDLVASRENYLIIINALFGVLSGSTYGLSSIASWIATNKLERSWFLWYISRPVVGASLAIVFYLILRAGIIKDIPLTQNDYGFAAISYIAGLIATHAMKKIRDIFDTLFGIKKTDQDKGDEAIGKNRAGIKIGVPKTKIQVNEEIDIRADITIADGAYADDVQTSFGIDNPNVVMIKEGSSDGKTVTVNSKEGLASVAIKGLTKGKAIVSAIARLNGESVEDKIEIEVIDRDTPPM
jgi:general stress protein 26